MAPESITEDELHAYLDGALTAKRRRAVEAQLGADPEAVRRFAAYREQNERLHLLFDPVLAEPVPKRLEVPRSGAFGAWRRRVAASVLILVAGGAAGWWLRGAQDDGALSAGDDLAHSAAIAHAVFTPEVRHPVEVTAEQEAHLVKWLSKRLKAPVRAPSLLAGGYNLIGGRLLSAAGGPAALFMYESDQGRRLTLYVTRRPQGVSETAFRYAHEDGIGVFYWIDATLSYALAGELDKAKLLDISRIVYDQVDK